MILSDLQDLPVSANLPYSDEITVANEAQNFIPDFLLFLLQSFWAIALIGSLRRHGNLLHRGHKPHSRGAGQLFELGCRSRKPPLGFWSQ